MDSLFVYDILHFMCIIHNQGNNISFPLSFFASRDWVRHYLFVSRILFTILHLPMNGLIFFAYSLQSNQDLSPSNRDM